MLSFRIEEDDASAITRWAADLGVDRSEILRDAVRRHLALLEAESDVDAWQRTPPTEGELDLDGAADWGPAEDWSDWR